MENKSRRKLGILTENERAFLLRGDYGKLAKDLKKELKTMSEKEIENALAMRRYMRSNINRKAKQALSDLKLIFEKAPRWEIGFLFPEENLLKLAVESAYSNNRATESARRRRLGRKRKLNKNAVKKRTANQLQERIEAILDGL